jgi:hypothetical protein
MLVHGADGAPSGGFRVKGRRLERQASRWGLTVSQLGLGGRGDTLSRGMWLGGMPVAV